MTGMSRRDALAASLGLAVAPVAAAPNPDVELAHWCGVYVAACESYNSSRDDSEDLWDAILAAEEEIDARPPQTLAGVIEKARVAIQLVKQEPEERSDWGSSPAGSWAQEVVLDLARPFGERAA